MSSKCAKYSPVGEAKPKVTPPPKQCSKLDAAVKNNNNKKKNMCPAPSFKRFELGHCNLIIHGRI